MRTIILAIVAMGDSYISASSTKIVVKSELAEFGQCAM